MRSVLTCRSCREKDLTTSWREKHGKPLCAACNVDHDRVAADYFVAGTLALEAVTFTLSPRALAVMGARA